MANLLATLLNSASALDAFSQVMQVTQNNVANSTTPGYAKQSLPIEAMPFDPVLGLSGGVLVGKMQSTRDEYAEQAVRRQNTALGQNQQAAASLQSLQSNFDISGNTGIPNALNQFFQSVSAWGQTPSDTAARQTVIDRASLVAQTFQNTATTLQNLTQDTETQLQSTVDQVNKLVGQIQGYNHIILSNGSAADDQGIDANVHAALESLSHLVGLTTSRQTDGTTTVLLNGTTPLLIADHQYSINVGLTVPSVPPPTYPNAPPAAVLHSTDGADITAKTTDGQLGALLDMRNRILPSYLGGPYEAGDLNSMAQQFADRVNTLLTNGTISDGPPPVPGVPLFTYDTTNATNVAKTLAVDPTVTPDQLAATDPGPPYISNGVPLALSQFATPTDPANKINGVSYTQFYGNLAASVGSRLQTAQNGVQIQQSLLAQAKNQRQQLSGVNLDEEAMVVIEFQRAYQASSKLITVLDDLTQAMINILH